MRVLKDTKKTYNMFKHVLGCGYIREIEFLSMSFANIIHTFVYYKTAM